MRWRLGLAGLAILVLFVNALTAALTFASLIGYAVVYTVYLKRATPQNIVIGGAAGAAPASARLDGCHGCRRPACIAAVPHHLHLDAAALLGARDRAPPDYERADIPMLPVTHGEELTKSFVVYYTILLLHRHGAAVDHGHDRHCSIPSVRCCSAAGFLYYALQLKFAPRQDSPMTTFRYSIAYLMALFSFLLIDHYIPAVWPM